jgi:hypothetical protein
MHRYRVHIVPRTGRFAPLLTILVEAESRDQAFQIAQARCASSKVVSAEDVGSRGAAITEPVRLRVVGGEGAGDVAWHSYSVASPA